MLRLNRFAIISFFVVFSLCFSLLNTQVVFADDTPPPTEEAPPTEVVSTEETPTEEPSVTEEPTSTSEVEEDISIAEVLQSTEDTSIVVFDENGNNVPLATQQAQEIAVIADPVWCPAAALPPITPGTQGCSASFASFALLLNSMNTTPASYAQHGVIYVEITTITTAVNITSTAYPNLFSNLSSYNLTIQGGWNTGTGQITGTTTFDNNNNATLTIGSSANRWGGNITINDLLIQDNITGLAPSLSVFTSTGNVTINDVSLDDIDNSDAVNISTTSGNIVLNNLDISNGTDGDGLVVTTTSGNISLNDVDITNQADGNTANLTTTNGNILINNGSQFDGNNGGGNNNQGFTATATNGSITITGTSTTNILFQDARGSGTATNYYGLTLRAPTITLTYVRVEDNDGGGIHINNTGLTGANVVTLNNVISTANGTDIPGGMPAWSNDIGSGVRVDGNGSTRVIVNGGTFTNNERYGFEVFNVLNNTVYVTTNPTCTGNGGGCYNITQTNDNTAPVVTPIVTGTSGTNGWYTSDVTVSWTVTDAQSGIFSGCNPTNLTSETTGTTVSCTATNNAGLQTTASVTVKIDKTAPTANLGITAGIAGTNGWYISPVTVQTTGTDSISSPVTCTADQTFNTDTTGVTVNGSCTNDAGLTTNASSLTLQIDQTAPTLTLPANITEEATSAAGAFASFSASSSDNFDPAPTTVCTPASGSFFNFGVTSVNCYATDEAGNTTNGSFDVIVQDTTAPTISPVANINVNTTNPAGEAVTYTDPTTTDIVDGAGVATCAPASGTVFSVGTTTVTCTATDAASNTSSVTFDVIVTLTSSGGGGGGGGGTSSGGGTSTSSSTSTGTTSINSVIPVTGTSTFTITCPPANFKREFEKFNITFKNLCGAQSTVSILESNTLPANLPAGTTFISGFSVNIIQSGQDVNPLPGAASLTLDFVRPASEANKTFAILHWDGSQWTEISGQNAGNFYQGNVTFTGIFIVVTK
jgi:hypothetical protein